MTNKAAKYLKPRQYQQGLTLIELLISITLGLLVSAAATALFINSVRAYRVQTAVLDLQDTAVFGLNVLSNQVALANLGSGMEITDQSPWGGIVITGSFQDPSNNSNQIGNMRGITVSDQLLSISGDGAISPDTNGGGWTGVSNVKSGGSSIKSDQLVVQFRPPYDMQDCEGNVVAGAKYDTDTGKMSDGDMLVQRYYLAVDPNKPAGLDDKLSLVLMCDAATYTPPEDENTDVSAGSISISGYASNPAVLMRNVDQFHVRLGVQLTNGLRYMTLKEYKALSVSPKPSILAVQFGVIAKAGDSVAASDAPSSNSFTLYDQALTIENTSNQYLRRAYTNTVMLRNGRNI